MKRHTPLPALFFNVPMIANKTPREVERLLGRPDGSISTPGRPKTKVTYRNGAVNVTFDEGRATQIVLRKTLGLSFSEHALAKLGLPVRKASRSVIDGVLRWENLCGLAEVSLFPTLDGDVSHVFVSVRSRRAAAA